MGSYINRLVVHRQLLTAAAHRFFFGDHVRGPFQYSLFTYLTLSAGIKQMSLEVSRESLDLPISVSECH